MFRRLPKNLAGLCVTLSACLGLWLLSASAALGDSWKKLSDDQKLSYVKKYAKPLAKKTVFYNWLSPHRAEQLLREGVLTDSQYEYYMSIPLDEFSHRGGPGYYVSRNPVNSMTFGTAVIEVHVEAGALMLDSYSIYALDRELRSRFFDYQAEDVIDSKLPFLFEFDGSLGWLAVRVQKGVSVHPFDPSRVTSAELMESVRKKGDPAFKTFRRAVAQRAVELALSDVKFVGSPAALVLLDRQKYLSGLRDKLLSISSAKQMQDVLSVIEINPEVRRWVMQSNETRILLVQQKERYFFLSKTMGCLKRALMELATSL